jgi:uncharacterized RDD family membrane protein YckC
LACGQSKLISSIHDLFFAVIWTDDRPQDEQGSGTIVFVYLWTVGSLIVLGALGNRLFQKGHYDGLRWMLYSFVNYAFIVMVLMGGLDAIQNDGGEIQWTGWYGQTSVLVFLTCLFGMIHAVFFQFWLIRKATETKERYSSDFELMGNDNRNMV